MKAHFGASRRSWITPPASSALGPCVATGSRRPGKGRLLPNIDEDQAKKGISALQIQRNIGMGSYRTAWFMCHRIRAAMKDEAFQRLTGVVEVDETFVGGKARNRHGGGIGGGAKLGKGGRGPAGKVNVVGAIARKGNVVCQVIEATDAKTLGNFVDETVSGCRTNFWDGRGS